MEQCKWSSSEKAEAEAGMGQLSYNTADGTFLFTFLESYGATIKNLVEIGTWNGLGSTLCILRGIQNHPHIEVFSLECNKEKQEIASQNLEDFLTPNIHLLWGSILDTAALRSQEYLSNFPELIENPMYQEWHEIDMYNAEQAPNVLADLPKEIDFLLLDGGEFTTLYEFQVLVSRCKRYIFLDDCNVCKCRRIRELLKEDPMWEEFYSSDKRHGFCAFRLNNFE